MSARDSEKIHAAIEQICQSAVFCSAPQLQKLLRFLASASLTGDQLKESLIGIHVFERDPAYDPKADSVVRTEVRRLRLKLAAYYIEAGVDDTIIIEIPKGSYKSVQWDPLFDDLRGDPEYHRLLEGMGLASKPEARSPRPQLSAHVSAYVIAYIRGIANRFRLP